MRQRDPAPTPGEKAVADFARTLYPDQRIVSASCAKTGFSPAGDVDTCTLLSADGSQTDPSEWTITRDGSTGELVAVPEGAGG